HRFDAEERSFRVRDGERRVPFEIEKGDWRATNVDGASADRASGAKRSGERGRSAAGFSAGRDVALARYRFPDGGDILPRGLARRACFRRRRQGGNRRNGGVYYRSDESDE